jgi:hypothetical protein
MRSERGRSAARSSAVLLAAPFIPNTKGLAFPTVPTTGDSFSSRFAFAAAPLPRARASSFHVANRQQLIEQSSGFRAFAVAPLVVFSTASATGKSFSKSEVSWRRNNTGLSIPIDRDATQPCSDPPRAHFVLLSPL